MDSEEYLGWCLVENTVSNRLKDNSLVYTLSSKCHIRKSTKLINQELKKSTGIKTYSQYVKCKKNILEKITENTDVTDESDFSDDDYKKFYNSFEVSSKDKSKSDVGDEGFVWLFVEKKGRKKTESELDDQHLDDLHPHIWEPSIDISVIEDISDPFEKPSKSPKRKKVNGLIDTQSKAKSCSPHKSNTKLNIKNVTSSSTSKVDNIGSKLTLKKETPVKEGKVLQSSKTKKSINKSPKDIKKNLTSVINGVSSKTPDASEGDDWNHEFVHSDFQAHSTQIFSDTLSDANRGRRSVSRLRFSQNEVINQPRDSGIEEDSREENVSVVRRASDKKSDNNVQKENKNVQENSTPKKTNEGLRNSVDNVVNNVVCNTRHKLPLKIIGEERVTTKFKIISNKDLKPIIEEKQLSKSTIVEQMKEESKKKSESGSDSEYVDTQDGHGIDNSKQETEESSDEYYDLHDERDRMDSDNDKMHSSKTIKSPSKINDGKVNKLPRDNEQLFTEESSEESCVDSKTSKKNTHATKNKNKQIQKKINHLNVKSDKSTVNDSIISDIASLQSSPISKRHSLSKESRKILNKSSDREESYEIEPQQDLTDVVKNYKKTHFANKITEKDSKNIKSVHAKDNDSEDSEESANEKTLIDSKLSEDNQEVEVPEQTSKCLSQTKKFELAGDEESSESEDEVKKDPPVQFILPDKKSDSEESEESEIEETPAVFQSKKRDNDEEGHLSIHAERRLAEMRRLDFTNYHDSEDSEEEKNSLPIKNINAKGRNSKKQELEDSDDCKSPTKNPSIENNESKESDSDESEKADSKKDSEPVEQAIIKNQDSDSEAEESVPNHTLKHLSQMKKTNLANSDSSSDEEEINLDNKDQVLNNVKKQTMNVEEDTMSSHEKQHLQKMKRLSFDNDSEDSNDSTDQKVQVDDDIEIEEHKVTLPEGYHDSEFSKLMVEDSFSSGIMEKTKLGAEKTPKSKKKDKLNSKEATGASQEVNAVHYSSENETLKDKQIPNKKSDIIENEEESDEESDAEEPRKILTQANKVNVRLSYEDDDSDSDRSMSPSATHRLSQYKKMNLIEKDSSSSSSEDEDNKKNDVLPKKVESHNFKSDDSDEEKSEKSLKSNEKLQPDNSPISEEKVSSKSNSSKLSIIDDSKESIKTCPEDDNKQKGKVVDKDKKRKNVVISETQECADIQENYVESQELFSSVEDLTEGRSKASVLESNDQKRANEVSVTPEPIEIFREKITNISQLIEKEKLLPATYEPTMTTSHFSPDEDIYLLEVPQNVFNNNLIGEQFSFSKTTLKVGLNAYEAFKRKVAPTLSCVFQSEDHGGDSYETINVRPVVSIVARRRQLVDEPSDKPPHQENQEVEDTGTKSKSAESDPSKTKKKKAKTKDAPDFKKVKTPKKVNLSDMTTEPEKKKRPPKKKADITKSPGKTKKSENNEDSARSLAETSNNKILYEDEKPRESPIKSEKKEKTSKKENLKSSPKKVNEVDETFKENVVADTITDAKKKKKKAKAKTSTDSPNKIKKEETIPNKNEKSKNNKFKLSEFVKKPKPVKKMKEKEPNLEQWNDDANMKRKLSAICDDDSNSIDGEYNVHLSPPLKKQKIPIRDATNVSEEDVEQVKLASKTKLKSKMKKVNGEVKTVSKSKVTKPKNTLAENNDVFAEEPTSPSSSKSKPVNKPVKAETKKSSKKRKSDSLLNEHDDPNVTEKPAKKKKTKPAGEGKPKAITKAARVKMEKESAEMKDTLFGLFRKTMKCDQLKFLNPSDSNPDNSKYKPLELEHTTSKKSRLDMMSSSSDEDDTKCNFNKSFKMREKPKPDHDDESSNSSSDFIPNSQSAFKCEETKKPKKIFFNE